MNLKKLVFNLIIYSKINVFFEYFSKDDIVILTFHRFHLSGTSNNSFKSGLSISDSFLEELILYLKKNFIVISIDECYDLIKKKNPLKHKKYIVFTIDDGYKDNYKIAYPVFKKYSIPFTIYVTTSFPDKKMIYWWYIIEDIFQQKERIEFTFKNDFYSFDKKSFRDLRSYIVNQDKSDYFKLMELIIDKYNINLSKYYDLSMSWEEIKELNKDELVTIGAHTVNHLALSKLEENEIFHEVIQSKRIIENHIGNKVTHFAYPFGSRNEVDERVINILEQLDFKTSVTTYSNAINLSMKNRLNSLSRIVVNGNFENINYLKLQLNGFIRFIEKLKSKFF